MSKEFLDSANIVPILEQVCGKGMAKGMTADRFVDVGALRSLAHGFLQTVFVEMMALRFATAWISGKAIGREDVLSAPFAIRVGVFAFERVGKVNRAVAAREVLIVQTFDALQVFLKWLNNGRRKHRYTIFAAFAIADDDLTLGKINILDAQADRFD